MYESIIALTEGLDQKSRKTVLFAANELKRYLEKVTKEETVLSENEISGDGIVLGVNLKKEADGVKDKELDDVISVDVSGGKGTISGSNARSVLIAVYRYLRELGFSFFRPGKHGEVIPDSITKYEVYLKEAASYRHRGICIEGSVDFEDINDVIDWLPKVAMNSYFIQFFLPRIFFDRWYLHTGDGMTNPYLAPEKKSDAEIEEMMRVYEENIELRSLIYHGVGHGWTCQPFGLPSYSWDPISDDGVPSGAKECFALVNGKRELFGGVALNTNLCYGNPDVREKIINAVLDYCKNRNSADFLHVWLADGENNNCECERCKDTRPADFYVKLLNDIDQRLTAENIDTKIVFLMYVDLLFAPVREKIKNPDRFTFMFAPIGRSYSTPLAKDADKYTVSDYVRNKLTFPSASGEYMAYYREWQKAFAKETFVFDYYYMWDCYKDLGGVQLAKLIHEDISSYGELGFEGLISCQGQRVFSPSSLGMNVMAQTLWNKNADFEKICDEVLAAEYGDADSDVKSFIKDMSTYSLPSVARLETPLQAQEAKKAYTIGKNRTREFIALTENRTYSHGDDGIKSLTELRIYAEILEKLFEVYIGICEGEDRAALWNGLEDFVNRKENLLKGRFDAFEFKSTLKKIIRQLSSKN